MEEDNLNDESKQSFVALWPRANSVAQDFTKSKVLH
jgi:hypothetical protein